MRYDSEYVSQRSAGSTLFQDAENTLGVVEYIPRDTNNIAPRLGFSWDPFKSAKNRDSGSLRDVLRTSTYGTQLSG